jgi:hypothetical protein
MVSYNYFTSYSPYYILFFIIHSSHNTFEHRIFYVASIKYYPLLLHYFLDSCNYYFYNTIIANNMANYIFLHSISIIIHNIILLIIFVEILYSKLLYIHTIFIQGLYFPSSSVIHIIFYSYVSMKKFSVVL